MATLKDIRLAAKAKRHGARYPLYIIQESRVAGIPASLGFALVEQETDFNNIFGHDPTIFVGAGKVTKKKYLAYKAQRGPTGRGGMQGVGLVQLTYYGFQDAADKLGGCWRIRPQLKVGFGNLANLIKTHGRIGGYKAYNGTGPAADRYATLLDARQQKWHNYLK